MINDIITGMRRPCALKMNHSQVKVARCNEAHAIRNFQSISQAPVAPPKGLFFHCTQPPITTRDLDIVDNCTSLSLLLSPFLHFAAQLGSYIHIKLQTFRVRQSGEIDGRQRCTIDDLNVK
jgi:hypothetical protein